MDAVKICVASLATWRAAHLLHAEEGPWQAVARLRQALHARQFGVLECFFCVSVWTALPATVLTGAKRRQFLLTWPALSAAAVLLERAAFPDTFADVPDYAEDEYPNDQEASHVLRQD